MLPPARTFSEILSSDMPMNSSRLRPEISQARRLTFRTISRSGEKMRMGS